MIFLKLQILTIISILTIMSLFDEVLSIKILFPFMKVKMKSKLYNKLNFKFNCNEMYQNVRECAEQCYFKEKHEGGCLGFIKYKNKKECSICYPASNSNITVSNYTNINNNHLIYILKYKKKIPVMYLPLDGDNVTGTTVVGDGVTGTLLPFPERTQIQAGKVNQGLYVRNGGKLVLDNTKNACIGNLSVCTNGLSIALWIRPSVLGGTRHITHSEYSINIAVTGSGTIGVWTSGQPNTIPGFGTQSTAPMGTWTHVAVVFDPDVGMSVYMNGRLDAFKSINEAFSASSTHVSYDYVFGSKANGGHPFKRTLDEIKVFYDRLSGAGRESYEMGLKQVLLKTM